ncbi:hypothetical protein TTSV1_gp17 [Thermoproteus tenax spherical virus 1]|uniref:Uncharacterized protein n=1 Tax=Thermoproteus tenax spherical virus 1 TaxID=292639 RepID=Q647E5_9VIRU|nr:hypothetical protein TTSV1_gp17 [Thermoproteus tenax spherical virus 1]AAU25967.1 hypothetical protein [Thermoproteus tenax spherical virus 1]
MAYSLVRSIYKGLNGGDGYYTVAAKAFKSFILLEDGKLSDCALQFFAALLEYYRLRRLENYYRLTLEVLESYRPYDRDGRLDALIRRHREYYEELVKLKAQEAQAK